MTGKSEQFDSNFDDNGIDAQSAADVLRKVEEIFQVYISPEAREQNISDIHRFLSLFNVKDAELADPSEIAFLLEMLDENPSQVKDFVYLVTDVNTGLRHDEYPRMPHMSDLWIYAHKLDDPSFTIRDFWREKYVVPNLMNLGLERGDIVSRATSDLGGRVGAAEVTRFMGWLAGQRFMINLPYKLSEYLEELDVEEPTLPHAITVAILEVRQHRKRLRNMAGKYRDEYPMEVEARPDYEDAVLAVEGVWNLCSKFLLGERTEI